MKFSASVVLLLCATLTTKGASCSTNSTFISTSQLQEPSKGDSDHTTTSSTDTATTKTFELHETTSNANATTEKSPTTQQTQTQKAAAPLNSNTKRTCACDDTEESLICASNGITYKNTCRFECAKARVNRLRQVKQGRCSQAAGAQSYWQSTKSG